MEGIADLSILQHWQRKKIPQKISFLKKGKTHFSFSNYQNN
jgi:hypothetical protein